MNTQTQQTIKIGTYELLATIGHGNFSVCKLALNKLNESKVAIKCVEKKSLDESHLKRIYREIDIMKSLDHRNIIKLYQVMESKSMLYLVCEYAVNGELFDFILKNGAMSERTACEKFCKIISAVEYCHNKNIVHRDLKTENLLLDPNMNIKLADFGFANHFDLVNPLKTFCGSPPYAAPEIFCGKQYFGPEIDIWSMGVILYVLVTGSLPFDSENLQLLKQRVLTCKYNLPYFLSNDCQSLISHMIELSPVKRFKIQQIKSHKWIKLNHTATNNASNSSLSDRRRFKFFSSNKNTINNVISSSSIHSSKSLKSLKNAKCQENDKEEVISQEDGPTGQRTLIRLSSLSLPLFSTSLDEEFSAGESLQASASGMNKTNSYYQIKDEEASSSSSNTGKKLVLNTSNKIKSKSFKSDSNHKANLKLSLFKNFAQMVSNDITTNNNNNNNMKMNNYSTSLDESGVESDFSSQTSSSFSSDLLSSSITSCYSIQHEFISNSNSNRRRRLKFEYQSSTSSNSSSSNNLIKMKKNSLPASSLTNNKQNKLAKNSVNNPDLQMIKHELNSLIKNVGSTSANSTSHDSTSTSGLLSNLISNNSNNSNKPSIKEEENNVETKQTMNRQFFSRLSGHKKTSSSSSNTAGKREENADQNNSRLARLFGLKSSSNSTKRALKEKSSSLNSLTDDVANLKLQKVVVYKADDKNNKNNTDDISHNQSQTNAKSNNYFDRRFNFKTSSFKFYRKYSLKS